MKKPITFTPSQVVNLVLVLFSIISPAVVKALSDAGYQFDPTLMATYGAGVAVIVGGCRAYLSSNSGTQSGVPSGPDRKAWAASSTDAPPLNALVGVSAPLAPSSQAVYYGTAPLPVTPDPAAPVSVAPGAAQGVSETGFSDVAAADDGHNLIAGEEQT